MKYEKNSQNDKFTYQINILSNDLDHIFSLKKINIGFIIIACLIMTMILILYAQFISDLITEHDRLFLIYNWVHQNQKKQNMREQYKTWFNIIQNNFNLVHNFLTDEKKQLENIHAFFKYQNENWVLALETLNQVAKRILHTNTKLFKWATCQNIPQSTDISKFNENLQINIRAELFCKVMTIHSEIILK